MLSRLHGSDSLFRYPYGNHSRYGNMSMSSASSGPIAESEGCEDSEGSWVITEGIRSQFDHHFLRNFHFFRYQYPNS